MPYIHLPLVSLGLKFWSNTTTPPPHLLRSNWMVPISNSRSACICFICGRWLMDLYNSTLRRCGVYVYYYCMYIQQHSAQNITKSLCEKVGLFYIYLYILVIQVRYIKERNQIDVYFVPAAKRFRILLRVCYALQPFFLTFIIGAHLLRIVPEHSRITHR